MDMTAVDLAYDCVMCHHSLAPALQHHNSLKKVQFNKTLRVLQTAIQSHTGSKMKLKDLYIGKAQQLNICLISA